MKSVIPLQQDAFRLEHITLPDYFNFNFELKIESSNFNHSWQGWRSILGLNLGELWGGPGLPGGRYPAFFLFQNKRHSMLISIYTEKGNRGDWVEIKLDDWPSFINVLFFWIINSIYLMIQTLSYSAMSSTLYQTRWKVKISFSKTPDGFNHNRQLYSVNGNQVWHRVDEYEYTLENMKLYIGGVHVKPIGNHPTASGYVRNINLEIFKHQPGIQKPATLSEVAWVTAFKMMP